MSNTLTDRWRPLPPLHSGPGTAGPRTWRLVDDSKTVFPRRPDGTSVRVVIIVREVRSSHGAVFRSCRNAGRWSFRITFAGQSKPTSVTRTRFLSELRRLGGEAHAPFLLAAV